MSNSFLNFAALQKDPGALRREPVRPDHRLVTEGITSRRRDAALLLGQMHLGSNVNRSVAVRDRFVRRL